MPASFGEEGQAWANLFHLSSIGAALPGLWQEPARRLPLIVVDKTEGRGLQPPDKGDDWLL